MSVSRRLVTAAGRPDLWRDERYGTDDVTLDWEDRGGVRRLLQRRGLLRVPRTVEGLERMLVRKIGVDVAV